jgi:hypothetical protein
MGKPGATPQVFGGFNSQALKARNTDRADYVALSALQTLNSCLPGALPQAFIFRAFGAGNRRNGHYEN